MCAPVVSFVLVHVSALVLLLSTQDRRKIEL
jgi:hypothetical protein